MTEFGKAARASRLGRLRRWCAGGTKSKAAGSPALSEVEGSARATRSLSWMFSDGNLDGYWWDGPAVLVPSGMLGLGGSVGTGRLSGVDFPGRRRLTRWVPLHAGFLFSTQLLGENSSLGLWDMED